LEHDIWHTGFGKIRRNSTLKEIHVYDFEKQKDFRVGLRLAP
jgi:hypothetical protein